jgi:hypothetical protein
MTDPIKKLTCAAAIKRAKSQSTLAALYGQALAVAVLARLRKFTAAW